MELKTIRQVSLDYGISRQMLCYYEQIGLVKSTRKDNYAYRVYDEDAIKRLQQIVILRKLQIPMKHIKNILGNQDAVAVIEIFKQNIGALDEEITALSTLKSILARFVDELQEKVDVHLKLDLLNDKTMISLVDSLSFAKHKIKEKVSMDELNQASEQMRKKAESEVRVTYLPPATMVREFFPTANYPDVPKFTESIFQKFIDDVNLFKIKPDTRIYGFHHGGGGYEIWAAIPDDLDVPAPLSKYSFGGGLYARHPSDRQVLNEWIENSDDYKWAPMGIAEYINPINLFGHAKGTGSTYTDHLQGVEEIKKISGDAIETALKKLDNVVSHGEPAEIDLTSMIRRIEESVHDFDVAYTDGLMVIKNGTCTKEDTPRKGMESPRKFTAPLKIELRAKTDSKNIVIAYAQGLLDINWNHSDNTIAVQDIVNESEWRFHKSKDIPLNEFADIEWILGRDIMVVRVNGEVRHIGDDYGYIKEFQKTPNFCLSSSIGIATGLGATVTVEQLRVTEI